MTGAITFGAGPSDTIRLVGGASQAAPVGGQAASPIVVQVLAADGVTPVAGASIFLIAAPAAGLAACSGASSCTISSDQSGFASTFATAVAPVTSTITAELAPASYNPAQEVQATLFGTSSALDIALVPQSVWIAQGATLTLPLTARVLSNGNPLAGTTVDFQVLKGAGLLTSASATANNTGYASNTLQVSSLAGDLQVSACIKNQPVDAPCLNFHATAVPASGLQLLPVSGNPQLISTAQSFAPVVFQVTNATGTAPVLGATVNFQSVVERLPANAPAFWLGDTSITGNPMPVILSSSQIPAQSDGNGLVSFRPATNSAQGAIAVLGSASLAGASSLPFTLQSVASAAGSSPQAVSGPVRSIARQAPKER